MPEYTYLLENRLTAAQKHALTQVRDATREAGMTVFLAGGAVRDLTTGSSVRDLDFAIQGNALDLQKAIETRGGTLWGRHDAARILFFWFPGSVRVEVASTRAETFPKPGQPVYEWTGIVDDLHRRDFTANAMALSLNDGSYGLLLDPLNGVADIEARQLRLVSNYGFLEDPSRLVRAVRLRQRLGWTIEERTATRYENAKKADNFDAISPFLRGYELEEIAAEEDALPVMKALEAEGWMSKLMPSPTLSWTSADADISALGNLHRNRIQLLMQGIAPDLTAAHLEVLTAKMGGEARESLKASMVRPGLRGQWESLDTAAKEFSKQLTSKDASTPSATWNLFHKYAAEPILWLAHTRKAPAVDAKFNNLFTVWPEAAKKVPVAMMLEMRITPDLAIYPELLHELFLQQIDGKLETDEAMRAFLETYSPPAPPPPVTLRRSRAKKSEAKGKRKSAARDVDDEDLDDEEDEDKPAARGEEDEDEESADEEEGPAELGAGKKLDLDRVDLSAILGRIESDDDEDESEAEHSTGVNSAVESDEVEDEAAVTIPPAPLVKGEAVAPPPVAKSTAPAKKAEIMGAPPVRTVPIIEIPSDAVPESRMPGESSVKKALAADKRSAPAKEAPAKQAAAKQAPKPAAAAKPLPQASAKKSAPEKTVAPQKAVKKAAPAEKETSKPAPAKDRATKPARTTAKPAKKLLPMS
jgi:tRNA nucleotidyltransferase (CCA-adding enzyme)